MASDLTPQPLRKKKVTWKLISEKGICVLNFEAFCKSEFQVDESKEC